MWLKQTVHIFTHERLLAVYYASKERGYRTKAYNE